jgi:ferredoxin/flavodoxin---NADP+ reductase
MAPFEKVTVLNVQHWNESLFSFSTSRWQGLRFDSGQFVTLGMEIEGRPLLRAYSVASPNYEERLDFLSIKVPHGPLTSRLQHLQPGDHLLMGRKASGSLLVSDLTPARNLYLFSTGTGLAPFMSVIRDPQTYERFEKVILLHGVRRLNDLAYRDYLTHELPRHEYVGDAVRQQLIYCPSVTREPFERQGRVDELVDGGVLEREFGLPPLKPTTDRAMICGSPAMLKTVSDMLQRRGFQLSPGIGQPGEVVIERAFADK